MNVDKHVAKVLVRQYAAVFAGVLCGVSSVLAAGQAGTARNSASTCEPSAQSSPFIPVDSWIYPAMLRLYSLGFVDDIFLGMRPWTRANLSSMLAEAGTQIDDADQEEGLGNGGGGRSTTRSAASCIPPPRALQRSSRVASASNRFTRRHGPSAVRLYVTAIISDRQSSTTMGGLTKMASITTQAPAATPRPAATQSTCAANSKERPRPLDIRPR